MKLHLSETQRQHISLVNVNQGKRDKDVIKLRTQQARNTCEHTFNMTVVKPVIKLRRQQTIELIESLNN